MVVDYETIKKQAFDAMEELVEISKVQEGDIVVVGCSSSEVVGLRIGKGSSIDAAKAVYEGIMNALKPKGIYLAVQCCEHLNRAVVIEREALPKDVEIVNAVPQPHAGGSFAVTFYNNAESAVLVEEIKADAGMDIGDTLIGMQLKRVAVPVRIEQKQIGDAHVVCARTRPKFIGGSRAVYNDTLSGGEIPRV